MNIEHQHTFGLPRKIVWKYIKNEVVLRNAIPSCRTFVQTSSGLYQTVIEVAVGPIKDVFALEVRLEKEKAPSYFHLRLKGKGNLGEINGKADLFLYDVQGSTKLDIHAEVQLSGTLSGAAQRVLTSDSNKGMEQFFLRLEKEIKKSLYLIRKGGKV